MKRKAERRPSRVNHSTKLPKPQRPISSARQKALQWPITVNTPEGQIHAYWIHKEAVKIGHNDEIHIRLVLERETLVLRCEAIGWVKHKDSKPLSEEIQVIDDQGIMCQAIARRPAPPVMFARDLNPELNPPIAFNTQQLRNRTDKVDSLNYFITTLAPHKTQDHPSSEIPKGKILLHGDLLASCIGYCHDDRTSEEVDFVTRRMKILKVQPQKRSAGRKGGAPLRCGPPEDLKAAVNIVLQLIKTTYVGKREQACETALRQFTSLQWPSGWRGLYYHVNKALKRRIK